MKIQIKSIAGSLLFEGDFSCIADAVTAAVKNSANLSYANLRSANLSYADLSSANLRSANLSYADLSSANLSYAQNSELAVAMTRILPEGDIIGWKKCSDGVIAKLLIPAKADRSHAFGRKCRAEFAEVLELWDGKKAVKKAKTERGGIYIVGEITKPDSWDKDFANECSNGIHFFITRLEAENYTQ